MWSTAKSRTELPSLGLPAVPQTRPDSVQQRITIKGENKHNRLTLADLGNEPFRVFFPMAVIAGLLGVALWPLYFWGVLEAYPGPSHTRLMGQGFFGGFIFGFLGTALPRMLSTRPFRRWQVGTFFSLFILFLGAHVASHTWLGDMAFLSLLLLFAGTAANRFSARCDTPPPGFVLVGLAFLCGIVGTLIGILSQWFDLDPRWLILRPLLAYQGFVLLPILGVGAYLLPKFFGLPNTHDLPESIRPPKGWWPKALLAFLMGTLIIGTLLLEAAGWFRTSHLLRCAAATFYMWRTIPLHRVRSSWRSSSIQWSLGSALMLIPIGLLVIGFWPSYRVALLHILFVGGLGIVTLMAATRVICGHSNNSALLDNSNRWLWWTLGMILLGMATRISGDFLPMIMISHYNYGALCWAVGLGIWSWKVLPKVLIPDR